MYSLYFRAVICSWICHEKFLGEGRGPGVTVLEPSLSGNSVFTSGLYSSCVDWCLCLFLQLLDQQKDVGDVRTQFAELKDELEQSRQVCWLLLSVFAVVSAGNS